jgi:hypothetical protein
MVRITNRTASLHGSGPGFGGVGNAAAICASPDVGVSNALQRVILLVSQVRPLAGLPDGFAARSRSRLFNWCAVPATSCLNI